MYQLLFKQKNTQIQNGFSLVEILLVVVVVGFIILTISNLPSSLGLIGTSSYQTIAREIAQKEIEEARSIGYSNLAVGVSQISDLRLNELPGGSANLTVSDCPVNICLNGEQIREVEVQVTWKDSGQNKNVVFTTLVSEGGLR